MATRPHLGVESFHSMVPSTHLVLGLRARPRLLDGNGVASLRFSRRQDTLTRLPDSNSKKPAAGTPAAGTAVDIFIPRFCMEYYRIRNTC